MIEGEEEEQREGRPKKRISGKFIVIFIIFIIFIGVVISFRGPVIDFVKNNFKIVSEKLKEPAQMILHPEEKFTDIGEWKTETKAVEKEKPKGVEITDFRSKRPLYSPGDPVETTSVVEIYGLEDRSTKINFKCESPNKEGSVFISGNENNEIQVLADGIEFTTINCKFDQGFDSGKHELKLSANYEDFISRSELKVYTLDKEKLDGLRVEKVNPFDYYRVKEPLLKKDKGFMKSTYTHGPLILTVNLNNMQPIDEEGIYELYIGIKEDEGWKGKISKMKSLKLLLPPEFDVGESCDLGENLALIGDELELGKEGAEYWCSFAVSEVSGDLTFSTVKLQVVYDYVFEEKISIEVKSKESSA